MKWQDGEKRPGYIEPREHRLLRMRSLDRWKKLLHDLRHENALLREQAAVKELPKEPPKELRATA